MNDLGPNTSLPPLNPAKARSFWWGLLAIAASIVPLMGSDMRELFGELTTPEGQEAARDFGDRLLSVANEIIVCLGIIAAYLERKAPNYRLSFREGR